MDSFYRISVFKTIKDQIFHSLLTVVLLYVIMEGCRYFAKQGFIPNYYTMNHLNYNVLCCKLFMCINAIIGAIKILKLGQRAGTGFKPFFILQVLMRLALACAFVYVCVLFGRKWLETTWTIIKDNNWVSDMEPFITNDSKFNAGFCWFFWLGSVGLILSLILWFLRFI